MNDNQYKRVGMRTIKSATAVLLCLSLNHLFCYIYSITTTDSLIVNILSFIFVRETPIYACIAAIIAMQSTVADSVKKGVARVIGTLLGGVLGLLFLTICNYFGHPFLEVAFATFGVILCFHFCNLMSYSDSGPISCVVLLIILVTTNEYDPVYYALDRVFDTIGGIIIAVLVNRFMFTPSFIWIKNQGDDEQVNYESVQKLH